eukprot:5724138-Pleurochrysis_carterae.AAC.1
MERRPRTAAAREPARRPDRGTRVLLSAALYSQNHARIKHYRYRLKQTVLGLFTVHATRVDRRPTASAAHMQCSVRHFDRARLYAYAAGTRSRPFLCTCSSRLLQSVHTVPP